MRVDDNLRWRLGEFFQSYLESKGVEFNGNANVLCPFHDDHTPSATFYDGTERPPRLFCHACGRGWDFIAAVRELENLGFADAVDFACRFAGISVRRAPEIRPPRKPDASAWVEYMRERGWDK